MLTDPAWTVLWIPPINRPDKHDTSYGEKHEHVILLISCSMKLLHKRQMSFIFKQQHPTANVPAALENSTGKCRQRVGNIIAKRTH